MAAAELARQKFGDRGRGFDGGTGIEKERARAPREHVLDRSGHLMAGCPHYLAEAEGQARVKKTFEARVFGGKSLHGRQI